VKTAIAILTYRRLTALETCLASVQTHCPGIPVAVFEDCGQTDDTEKYLTDGATLAGQDDSYAADRYVDPLGRAVFLGHMNLGVSGNSNRALRWFMEETDCDHLMLCNDDVEFKGHAHEDYAAAHAHHGVGFWCFSDFTSEKYRFAVVIHKGKPVKLLSRMTGIMLSITRQVVETIGYFDDEFVFGEEHCDYNNRARFAGFIRLNGKDQHCLDIPTKNLAHQEVDSSISPAEKSTFDREASDVMGRASAEYRCRTIYRPYSIQCKMPKQLGGKGGFGISRNLLRKLPIVCDRMITSDGVRLPVGWGG
jgi:hypothetical protein